MRVSMRYQSQVYRIAAFDSIRVYLVSMEKEIIDQGLTLMLAGMGTVIAFLTVLVAGMAVMSRTIMYFQRRAATEDATEEEVAAISAAIAEYRNK